MKIEEDFGKALGGFGKALGGFGSSWEGDRPPARPPDRLYILTPDQPRARPHISSSRSSSSSSGISSSGISSSSSSSSGSSGSSAVSYTHLTLPTILRV